MLIDHLSVTMYTLTNCQCHFQHNISKPVSSEHNKKGTKTMDIPLLKATILVLCTIRFVDHCHDLIGY